MVKNLDYSFGVRGLVWLGVLQGNEWNLITFKTHSTHVNNICVFTVEHKDKEKRCRK